jgi:hypothetical protein
MDRPQGHRPDGEGDGDDQDRTDDGADAEAQDRTVGGRLAVGPGCGEGADGGPESRGGSGPGRERAFGSVLAPSFRRVVPLIGDEVSLESPCAP